MVKRFPLEITEDFKQAWEEFKDLIKPITAQEGVRKMIINYVIKFKKK